MTSTLKAVAFAVLAAAAVQTAFAGQSFGADATRVLTFGVVPQQSATRLAKIWVPFLQAASERSGYQIEFTTAKDIPTFEECVRIGAYDIAYMNPYHYVEFNKAPGYQAFAHQAEKKLKGIVVARSDSGIANLGQLTDTEVAFPSPAAFGASVLPRAEMKQRGVAFAPKYVKSHDSVYRAVAAGIFPAGGGVLRTLRSIPDDLRSQLKVIYETSGYTPHAFAVHPDLPESVAQTIASAMTDGGIDESVVKDLGMAGIQPASDAAWDDVRALGLSRNQTELQEGHGACRSG